MKARPMDNNPYSDLICRYFQKEHPSLINKKNSDNVFELVSEILMGTKELRYGPLPSPEIMVNIRKVIKDAIDKKLPIPILVPWGGRKLMPDSILDVAEVAGLQQIFNVDRAVKLIYEPGLQINIRI